MGRFFDPNDGEIRKVYAEEAFIADIQHGIHLLMERKSVNRAELARRIGVSAAYVTQMLGNKPQNLTARTIAKVYSALGEEPCVRTKSAAVRSGPTDNWSSVAASAREVVWTFDELPVSRSLSSRQGLPSNSEWVRRYMKEAA